MAWKNLLECVYPVGSVYCSTINISPASSIGGSWTQIENAVLRSGDSVGYTGSDTHAITEQEMPVHSHEFTTAIYTHNYSGPNTHVNRTTWTDSTDAGSVLGATNAGGGASNVACPAFLQLLYLVQNCVDFLAVM